MCTILRFYFLHTHSFRYSSGRFYFCCYVVYHLLMTVLFFCFNIVLLNSHLKLKLHLHREMATKGRIWRRHQVVKVMITDSRFSGEKMTENILSCKLSFNWLKRANERNITSCLDFFFMNRSQLVQTFFCHHRVTLQREWEKGNIEKNQLKGKQSSRVIIFLAIRAYAFL